MVLGDTSSPTYVQLHDNGQTCAQHAVSGIHTPAEAARDATSDGKEEMWIDVRKTQGQYGYMADGYRETKTVRGGSVQG